MCTATCEAPPSPDRPSARGTFFGRYYQDGDFVSKRRYSRSHRYAMMVAPGGVSSVSLDSYIVSATPYEKLHPFDDDGSWTREDFAEKHILFQDDRGTSGYDYIAAVFGSKEP